MRYTTERQLAAEDTISDPAVVATAETSANRILSLSVDYPPVAGAGPVIDAAIEAMVEAVVDAVDYPSTRHVVTRTVDPRSPVQQSARSTGEDQKALF